MVFALLVCGELLGSKHNLEVPFPEKPTLPELFARIEQVFRYEARVLLQKEPRSASALSSRTTSPSRPSFHQVPESAIAFNLAQAQIYHDRFNQWVDLVSATQLHPYDQLYVFSRGVNPYEALSRDLPSPRLAEIVNYEDASASALLIQQQQQHQPMPPREHSQATPPDLVDSHIKSDVSGISNVSRVVAPQSALPTVPQAQEGDISGDEFRYVFNSMSGSSGSYVTQDEFCRMLHTLAIDFSDQTLEDMFNPFSSHGGIMSFEDFKRWASTYSTTFSAVVNRLADRRYETQLREQHDAISKRTEALHREKAELAKRLEAVVQQLEAEEREANKLVETVHTILANREQNEKEEQTVLDKEARVQFQRQVLMKEEADFVEAARRLEKRSTPGRAVPYSANSSLTYGDDRNVTYREPRHLSPSRR